MKGNEMNHTPGPWRYREGWGGLIWSTSTNEPVLRPEPGNTPIEYETKILRFNNPNDIKAILAVPEMLELLRRLADVSTDDGGYLLETYEVKCIRDYAVELLEELDDENKQNNSRL